MDGELADISSSLSGLFFMCACLFMYLCECVFMCAFYFLLFHKVSFSISSASSVLALCLKPWAFGRGLLALTASWPLASNLRTRRARSLI